MRGHELTLDLPEGESPTVDIQASGEGTCGCGVGWAGTVDGIRAAHYAHLDQPDTVETKPRTRKAPAQKAS